MQAIKDLADRLDGRPAQILEDSGPDSEPITKIIREIVTSLPSQPMKSQRQRMSRLNGVECVMGMEAAYSMRTPHARNASFDHAFEESQRPGTVGRS
jgi:hypothetical protein